MSLLKRIICLLPFAGSLLLPGCAQSRRISSQTKLLPGLDLVLLKGSRKTAAGKYLRGLFYTDPAVSEPVLYHWKFSPVAGQARPRYEFADGRTAFRIMEDGNVNAITPELTRKLRVKLQKSKCRGCEWYYTSPRSNRAVYGIYEEGRGRLRVIDLKGQEVKVKTPDFEFPIIEIIWTRDGQGMIVHTASAIKYRYVSRLYYLRKNFTGLKKIYDSGPGGAHLRDIQGDENSKVVYFLESSGPAKGEAVRRVSIANPKVETLHVFGPVGTIQGLQLSPDKKYLGFILQKGRDTVNQPGNLWRMKRNGKELQDLLKFPAFEKLTGSLGKYLAYKGVREFRWSPDGKSLVYTAALKGECKGRRNFMAGGLHNVKCNYSLYYLDLNGNQNKSRKILSNMENLKLIHWLPK